MDLIVTPNGKEFNTDAIKKGDFIRAKYAGWDEERNGLVVDVKSEKIRVMWQPGIRNVTNFFVITAAEVEAEAWTISWSEDLETVHEYPAGGPGE